jgi:hypothetical protein
MKTLEGEFDMVGSKHAGRLFTSNDAAATEPLEWIAIGVVCLYIFCFLGNLIFTL